MTLGATPPDPFDVVAKALGCPKEELSEESAIRHYHGWDSLGHVKIITAIEYVLETSITDDEVVELTNMKAICEFFDRQSRTDGK